MAYNEVGEWVPDEDELPALPQRTDLIPDPVTGGATDPNDEMLVVAPHGWRGAIKKSDWGKVARLGWRVEAPEETQERIYEQKYGDAPVRTFLESAGDAATFGAVSALTMDDEGLRQRRARNPGASIAGSIAGSVLPIPGTTAWGAAKAGKAVKGIMEGRVGTQLGGRLVTKTTEGIAEGAVFGAGMGSEQIMLSGDPMNAEVFLGAMGEGMLEGAAYGGIIGGGFEAMASGARSARAWSRAFRNPEGIPAAAGEGLTAMIPKRERTALLRAEEKRLGGEIAAEKSSLATRTASAVDDKVAAEKAREYAKRERVDARDQFEVELGILDETAHQARSRANLLRDVGGWPDDIVVNIGGVRKRINPMRELVDEVDAAAKDVQGYFPHAGETVVKKVGGREVTQRMFSLQANADNVASVMRNRGDDALAAVRRYERAMLTLHNAVNTDGRKALAASDFWAERMAPSGRLDLLGEVAGQEAKLAEQISLAEGAVKALEMPPLSAAKLASLESEMLKVREALKSGGAVDAARGGLAKMEKTAPGITAIDEGDVSRVLKENGLPNTPEARDVVRYHLVEGKMHAATKGATKKQGLGDMLGKGFAAGASGVIYGEAYKEYGWFGPVAANVILGLVRKKAGGFKGAADRAMKTGKKVARGTALAARKLALPTAIAIAKQPDSKPWSEKIAPVMRLANPAELDRAIQGGPLGTIASQDPEFAMQVRNLAWRKYSYLAQMAPKAPYPDSPFGGYKWEPSKADQAEWERRRHAAEDPESVIRRAADGTVTPEEAETLAVLYPETYQAVKDYMTENAIELQRTLPYRQRLSLSVLFGEPLEPTQRPESVMLFQASFENAETPDAGNAKVGSIKAPESTAAQRITNR